MKIDILKNTSLIFLSTSWQASQITAQSTEFSLQTNAYKERNGSYFSYKIYFVIETIALRMKINCRQTVNMMCDIF